MSLAPLAPLVALLALGTCARAGDVQVRECTLDRGPVAPVEADVDGDGRPDRVLHHLVDGEPTVEICFAGGAHYAGTGYGDASMFFVVDVDGDEAAEVLPGEDTGEAQTVQVRKWVGDELVPLGLTLRMGTAPGESEPRYLFGCEPPNRVVQWDFDWARRVGTATTYVVRGTGVTSSTRTVRVPRGARRETYLPTVVTPCPLSGRTPRRS